MHGRGFQPSQSFILAVAAIIRVLVIEADLTNEFDRDVVIKDITEPDIKEIGRIVNHDDLSDAYFGGSFPVKGTIFARNRRLFVPLTVQSKSTRKWVLFLVDTASPRTFLRADTYNALGITDGLLDKKRVTINSAVTLNVRPARPQFGSVNLLGQDFMRAAQIYLTVNYKTGEVGLKTAPSSR